MPIEMSERMATNEFQMCTNLCTSVSVTIGEKATVRPLHFAWYEYFRYDKPYTTTNLICQSKIVNCWENGIFWTLLYSHKLLSGAFLYQLYTLNRLRQTVQWQKAIKQCNELKRPFFPFVFPFWFWVYHNSLLLRDRIDISFFCARNGTTSTPSTESQDGNLVFVRCICYLCAASFFFLFN